MVCSAFMLTMVIGLIAFRKVPIDLYPKVSFPVLVINLYYPSASPVDIEQAVTKPVEDILTTVPGIESINSGSREGISQIIAKFDFGTDINLAEQKVRQKIDSIRLMLPEELEPPQIFSVDPADSSVLTLSLRADLSDDDLYELASESIKPSIEQVKNVGKVDLLGGRKREVHVELDRNKLDQYGITVRQVAQRLRLSGKNIPAGMLSSSTEDFSIRVLGEFDSVASVRDLLLNFYGNEKLLKLSDIGNVKISHEDEVHKNYINGKQSILFKIYRKSGANTVALVSQLKEKVNALNKSYSQTIDGFSLQVEQDGSRPILANVEDVYETIVVGVLLVFVVVFFFLGNLRSTFITGIAIPNSLIGSMVFLWLLGFSINLMTLLAMSLAVGLLIDDAIVVRENIFRHLSLGKSPKQASIDGANEVFWAVIGVTCCIVSVFGPVAFVEGVVGQFFREFGITICAIMFISTLDAVIMAPMLSAFLSKPMPNNERKSRTLRLSKLLDGIHSLLEHGYRLSLRFAMRHRILTILTSVLISAISVWLIKYVPKTFLPPADTGEFAIRLSAKPSTSLEHMKVISSSMQKEILELPQVEKTMTMVGGSRRESYLSDIFVTLVPENKRPESTSDCKKLVRESLFEKYKHVSPQIMATGKLGGMNQPFQVLVLGSSLNEVNGVARRLYSPNHLG